MAAKFAILAFISVLFLGALFFALRPDGPAAAPAERSFDVRITESGMAPEEVSVREGDRVNLNIVADRPAEIHVHGYDLEEEIEPGSETTLSFGAGETGRFPVEDHDSGAGLGVLVVEPR